MNIWKRIVKEDLGLCKERVLANIRKKTKNDFKDRSGEGYENLNLQIKMVANQN